MPSQSLANIDMSHVPGLAKLILGLASWFIGSKLSCWQHYCKALDVWFAQKYAHPEEDNNNRKSKTHNYNATPEQVQWTTTNQDKEEA
jgi:hypothetical protein